jgi:CubicO group peptidase (beta-lactamase class C family)
MLRTLALIIFWLTCLSCGQSNSSFYGFPRPLAPVTKNKISEKYKVLSTRIDSVFNQMVALGGFNGSVIVSKEGEIIYQKAFGIADRENNIPVTDSTMFQLASVSKVITATSVLMLLEKGLIKLEDSFSNYFPDFPYSDITVKHLLCHRSGLPNYLYFLNDQVSSKIIKLSNKDVLDQMIDRKPALYLKPDKAFNYCNTNYALLALLVEKVSGKNFTDFLHDEIFTPLGMKHSGTILSPYITNKALSKPYDTKWKPIDSEAADFVIGDKSIYSTPYDLFLFSEALYQNKLLNSETQELAFSALSREKKLSNYGLGWRMREFKSAEKKEVYHNGWWHGYRTAFHRRLSDKITIVVLSNQLNRTAYQTWKIYQAIDAGGLNYNDVAYEE